ncbi:phage tail tape measure protein [Palleronia caenipelagi]|uniref:Phage tail tape measure protein n=1 Tax=Palleronia caenipelagi TaxID=2489174 RepID=A0A547Q041_9RHOB|nr:phage tail tape measure protein [Palleronia caenipelagi]TRD19766.1 phage tail tape measure protein [Palleronia caenipelagi]
MAGADWIELEESGDMVSRFAAELRRSRTAIQEANREGGALTETLEKGLRQSFRAMTLEGKSLSDAVRGAAQSLSRSTHSAALRGGIVDPLAQKAAGALSQGAEGLITSLLRGGARGFARGGVVSGAVPFAMQGGLGVMGEAGPEAILPLSRGADGRLGVRSAGGAPAQVVINISTPDVEGFRRSQSQIAAEMSRALTRGGRNR